MIELKRNIDRIRYSWPVPEAVPLRVFAPVSEDDALASSITACNRSSSRAWACSASSISTGMASLPRCWRRPASVLAPKTLVSISPSNGLTKSESTVDLPEPAPPTVQQWGRHLREPQTGASTNQPASMAAEAGCSHRQSSAVLRISWASPKGIGSSSTGPINAAPCS